MRGQIFKKVQGRWAWYDKETGIEEGKSAFVHQDTMKGALTHPVTGEKVDSMTKWNRINKKHGLECVGNELLSQKKRTIQDKVGEERILDAIHKAESIMSDPTKKRAWDNEQHERIAKHEKEFGGNYRY